MSTYYNPETGNPEVWDEKPATYLSESELLAAHPDKLFAVPGDSYVETVRWRGGYAPAKAGAVEVISRPEGFWKAKSDGTWEPDKVSHCSALRTQLAELDAKYLTPRVLAGLATGDSFAQTQWQKHETEASPIRAQILELSKQ